MKNMARVLLLPYFFIFNNVNQTQIILNIPPYHPLIHYIPLTIINLSYYFLTSFLLLHSIPTPMLELRVSPLVVRKRGTALPLSTAHLSMEFTDMVTINHVTIGHLTTINSTLNHFH